MRNLTILAFVLAAGCGDGGGTSQGEPPPIAKGSSDSAFALENGTYYFERLFDLQDGCGRDPLDSSDSITSVAFNLLNKGDGQITIDRCIYDGSSVTGQVRNNHGTLTVLHSLRRDGSGSVVAEYQQECRLTVNVTSDNQIEGRSVERQSNRNAVMKVASGVDADSCNTSYDFTFSKR